MPKGHYKRGNRSSQPSPQPAPVTEAETGTGMPEAIMPQTGANVVALRSKGLLATRRAIHSGAGAAKHAILTDTKQRLVEAADCYAEGGAKAAEGKIIADKAAVTLFTARADGILTGDELSTLLGDTFGWKAKKGDKELPVRAGDNASKTPFGQGEAIRKRVVRAVQAHEYVTDADASKFFDGLPKEKVEDVLNRVRNNQLSIWSAYDMMGEIKRENVVRSNPAHNPEAIAKFVTALSQPAFVDVFIESPALQDAYLALQDMITKVDAEATIRLAKASAA